MMYDGLLLVMTISASFKDPQRNNFSGSFDVGSPSLSIGLVAKNWFPFRFDANRFASHNTDVRTDMLIMVGSGRKCGIRYLGES